MSKGTARDSSTPTTTAAQDAAAKEEVSSCWSGRDQVITDEALVADTLRYPPVHMLYIACDDSPYLGSVCPHCAEIQRWDRTLRKNYRYVCNCGLIVSVVM